MLGKRICTERLCLRKIEKEDLNLISDWSFSSSAYGEYLTPENHSVQDCFNFWKNDTYWKEVSKTLIIEHKEKNQPLGTIRFWRKQNDHRTALVALKIAELGFRGQGYGTEAQLKMISYLFTQKQYHAVEMFTDIDNVPEQRCLTKLGFTMVDLQTYEDKKVQRLGYLYRLTRMEYDQQFSNYR